MTTTWLVAGTSRGSGRGWATAALERLSRSLAQEVAGSGISVTLVEPGGLRDRWSRRSGSSRPASSASPTPAPAYPRTRLGRRARRMADRVLFPAPLRPVAARLTQVAQTERPLPALAAVT